MTTNKCWYVMFVGLLLLLSATLASTQTPSGQVTSRVLSGQVTDPSGAAIANASVILMPAAVASVPIKTQTNDQGEYEFKGLAAANTR